MYSNDVIKFMDDINTIMTFIEGSLRGEEIVNYRIKDLGNVIDFSILRRSYDVSLGRINKIDENSLRDIYDAIYAQYQGRMEIGATCSFKGKDVVWNLAPVIGEKTLVEFMSPLEKDQQWFYQEIENGTKQKGLS